MWWVIVCCIGQSTSGDKVESYIRMHKRIREFNWWWAMHSFWLKVSFSRSLRKILFNWIRSWNKMSCLLIAYRARSFILFVMYIQFSSRLLFSALRWARYGLPWFNQKFQVLEHVRRCSQAPIEVQELIRIEHTLCGDRWWARNWLSHRLFTHR